MKGKIKGRVGDLQTKQMVFQEVRKEMMGDEAVRNKLDRWWSTNGKEDSTCMRKEGRLVRLKGPGVIRS